MKLAPRKDAVMKFLSAGYSFAIPNDDLVKIGIGSDFCCGADHEAGFGVRAFTLCPRIEFCIVIRRKTKVRVQIFAQGSDGLPDQS